MYDEKLKKEFAEIKGANRYVNAVKQAVFDALMNFCSQSAEFAQAVEQSSKTFGQCCEAVVKGARDCIPDIEVYRRAADFYFRGAKVECIMYIHMSEWEEPGEAPAVEESADCQTSGDVPETEGTAAEEVKPKPEKTEIALDLFDLL